MSTREENIKKINTELEKLSDDELEKVAGGTYYETQLDGIELCKRGLLDVSKVHPEFVNDVLHKMGYTGYKGRIGYYQDNDYTDKKGNSISREQFWKNFDAENGTHIIYTHYDN